MANNAENINPLQLRQSQAIDAARLAMRKRLDVEELLHSEVSELGLKLPAWRTVQRIPEIDRHFRIELPAFFPDSPPRVIIEGEIGHCVGKIPHLSANGHLCVLPDSASIDSSRPGDLITHIVERACELLRHPEKDDFRVEFQSYWLEKVDKDATSVFLSDDPSANDTQIHGGLYGKLLILGSNKNLIESWLSNRFGETQKKTKFRKCLILNLAQALLPSQFPTTLWELRELVKDTNFDRLNLFDQLVTDDYRYFCVLIRQHVTNGVTYGAFVSLGMNLKANVRVNGFRKGKAPTRLLIQNRSKKLKQELVKPSYVYRVDHQWIHSRGGTGLDLSTRKIALIGCGSLGGIIAESLAKAGIGHLELIDNDYLFSENIGRHVLGAADSGSSKADSLAKKLRKNLPHLNVTSFYGDWRDYLEKNQLSDFSKFDVVVSTTGEWSCEKPLGLLNENSPNQALIIGWLEPYAVAGNALMLPGGSTFEDCFDEFGKFRHPATIFENSTLIQEPGGCSYYQQYGPVDLLPTAEIVSKLAIDFLIGKITKAYLKTWVRSESEVKAVGGKWGSFPSLGKRDLESFSFDRDWPVKNSPELKEE